ncbi:MAG TPA: helix-turn-helix domain-containing protein [Solirubrobacteraceae bacterium]|jgi:transcriptional regulator with XRE-family HTH domain
MTEIGQTLQEARMRAKIDVSEVEASTKIRAKYLRAIENEEWELLPGPSFVKSFLRTYAEYLGIDGKLLVEEYKLRYERPADYDLQPRTTPLTARERQRKRAPRPRVSRGMAIGLSLLGVVVLLLVLGLLSGNGNNGTAPPAHTAKRAARPLRKAVPAAPRPTVVNLKLLPQSDVYVCLRDDAGKLIVNQTVSPGQSKLHTSKRFRLTVGNSAIKMNVNGKVLGVPARSKPTNYELTPAGRRQLPDTTAANAC